MPRTPNTADAEKQRLAEDEARKRNWKRWGPYLAERQWGTVREDYSADGTCWEHFPHDQARSRAYRWGEDGLLGITDRQCRLCLSLALWNGRDPILKERLFGLTGNEGNHGEDVKECYYYLDATPTHSYMKALYKYPQREYPYNELINENRQRGRGAPEFELSDTGIFDDGRFFDVVAEYAKASPDDILCRFTIHNRGPEAAEIHLLPTVWYRNTWSWGRQGEGYWPKPEIKHAGACSAVLNHASLGPYVFACEPSEHITPELYFTDNETNFARLFGVDNQTRYVKDAFHERVVNGRVDAVNPEKAGTKCAAHYRLTVPAGGQVMVRARLFAEGEHPRHSFGEQFDATFAARIAEADAFHAPLLETLGDDAAAVVRQANAGLLWSKQFYGYVVRDWLDGDPAYPPPPRERRRGRNRGWNHLYNRDVLSMPDKWEYPWYAAWDLAFHMIPFASLDPHFAKEQLVLLLREWYMHPNGQIPAYEFAFGDVNPPVHAWAAWRVYKITGPRGHRDRTFLARVFNKLLMNFTWWVNRKDAEGRNLFSGGFLGLDNVGVFDRSKPLPGGGKLNQADGTAWMAFYCLTMLEMALELAQNDPAYEDLASKFFEHFVAIADATNALGGYGLWDDEDGFYYDQLMVNGQRVPLKVRSMVGLMPLIAVGVVESSQIRKLRGFSRRLEWFLENRKDLAQHISYMEVHGTSGVEGHRLLAVPSRERLISVLRYMLDENEFLSPFGIRSLSKFHEAQPYSAWFGDEEHRVSYDPGESTTGMFGGNSNWRGPVWFPVNYLLIEALEVYHHFYGDTLKVECPTGSGRMLNLKQVADELSLRLTRLFLPDKSGVRPCHGTEARYATDPAWRDLVLFYEYFHGDTGRGLGASHQTGWTALVSRSIEGLASPP
jgi:hypothetical protein